MDFKKSLLQAIMLALPDPVFVLKGLSLKMVRMGIFGLRVAYSHCLLQLELNVRWSGWHET